jgi:5-methyltetrahydropteroyltriglutamate--homocysteine methyltransferase
MTTRTQTVYRAETVGSLLRSDALKQARGEFMAERLAVREYKRIEDRAVNEAIALQEELGLDVLTDGEQRRLLFTDTLTGVIGGLAPNPAWQNEWHTNEATSSFVVPASVQDRIHRLRSLAAEEYTYARARTDRPVKVTLPSPLMMAYLWSPEHSPEVYPDPFDLFTDAIEILRQEIEELVALGCPYVQIDAPELAVIGTDEAYQQRFGELSGLPVDQMLAQGADLLNSVVEGIDGPVFGMHICRGNNEGRWMTSGGYDRLVTDVLHRATAYDIFLLEYDDPRREGGFEPLADLPQDKVVVLGLLSSKNPEMEDAQHVRARIEEAARHYPLEQLALSTQCGFASTMPGNPITPDTQKAKLESVVEIVRQVWG